jgi:hypothetical protein
MTVLLGATRVLKGPHTVLRPAERAKLLRFLVAVFVGRSEQRTAVWGTTEYGLCDGIVECSVVLRTTHAGCAPDGQVFSRLVAVVSGSVAQCVAPQSAVCCAGYLTMRCFSVRTAFSGVVRAPHSTT